MSPFPEEWRPEAAAIEAVLTVATDPVPVERADEVCEALRLAYEEEERGFELVRVAGGYRLQSHPAYRGYVERFILDDAPHRLSPAALETLASSPTNSRSPGPRWPPSAA